MESHLFKIDSWEVIKGIWTYAIKPLWWLWLLALGLSLFPIGLDRFLRWLKKEKSKK